MGRLHVNPGDRILASHINQLADYEVRGENCYEDELGAYFMGTKESDAVELLYGELKDDLSSGGSATAYPRNWDSDTSAYVTDTTEANEFEVYDALDTFEGDGRDVGPPIVAGNWFLYYTAPSGRYEIVQMSCAPGGS